MPAARWARRFRRRPPAPYRAAAAVCIEAGATGSPKRFLSLSIGFGRIGLARAADALHFSGSRDGRTYGSPISLSGDHLRFTGRDPVPMYRADSTSPFDGKPNPAMRAETEKLVDEIRQAISL